MIRSALIALGLMASGVGASAASAQGRVPTAPIVDACGGTRLVLVAADGSEDLSTARDVVAARMGGTYSQVFDYAQIAQSQIVVSVPSGAPNEAEALEPLLRSVAFGFHEVAEIGVSGALPDLGNGQITLPDAQDSELSYILNQSPILDGTAIADAGQVFDQNNRPAVSFRFNAEGARMFGDYTAAHIGAPVAIVMDGQVMSAPIIQSAIYGGSGMITGDFTVEEATALAVILRGGVLPFSLEVIEEYRVDGSNPSADFCP